VAEGGFPEFVVVLFSSWRDDPVAGLTNRVRDSVALLFKDKPVEDIPPSPTLAQTLKAWTERVGGELLIILDQFEEYFLYHPHLDGEGTFATEFPRAVNCSDLRASFLISIREDGLAKLDRFKGRIPNLFDNYLRIQHLDREAARRAIEKPVDRFNLLGAKNGRRVSIEPELVEAVLEQVRAGQVVLGDAGRGVIGGGAGAAGAETQIETPYLQLVMTRLWDEEMRSESDILRLETLKRLGRPERIVRTHLDGVMSALLHAEQESAAHLFHYLVTPSGTKIAHTVPDLADYGELSQDQIKPILDKLAGAEIRILRTVGPSPNQPGVERYEIFHDVLAPAILDWRTRYLDKKNLANERKRLRRLWIRSILVALLLMSSSIAGNYAYKKLMPWGYFRNLSTGSVYKLKGDVVRIGRSTEDIVNDISFIPRTVSRRHLEITQDNFLSTDLRSRNGTTVNTEFLLYGSSKPLQDGDFIILAGIVPLQFSISKLESSPPPTGWGMLINKRSKTPIYLHAEQYFLSLDEQGGIVVEETDSAKTLLVIRRYPDERVTIEDRKDDMPLMVRMRERDYLYPEYRIPHGTEFADFKTELEQHDLFEVSYRYNDVSFQIVLIVPYLEYKK
jgi:pSer/pThr/pTyr-binding forkhead associated (FHA) protein